MDSLVDKISGQTAAERTAYYAKGDGPKTCRNSAGQFEQGSNGNGQRRADQGRRRQPRIKGERGTGRANTQSQK